MKPKLGILGGTFNPVHKGHIRIGQELRQRFGLEKVLFMLSAHPPHKKTMAMPGAELRYQMLCRALQGEPGLEPCDLEIKRDNLSWTIDTLQELRRLYPAHSLYFIVGSEAFLRIRTWKAYRLIFQQALMLVILRKTRQRSKIEMLLAQEDISLLQEETSDIQPPGVYLVESLSPDLDLSSTSIRKRLKNNEPLGDSVAKNVITIMEEHDLYKH